MRCRSWGLTALIGDLSWWERGQPQFGRTGVGLQAFAVGQLGGHGPSCWAPASLTSIRLLRFWKS
jgi:hypothetical protein